MDDKQLQIFLKQKEEEDKKHKAMMKEMGIDMDDLDDQGFGDPELDALNDLLSKYNNKV
jgi:hypothetical protein